MIGRMHAIRTSFYYFTVTKKTIHSLLPVWMVLFLPLASSFGQPADTVSPGNDFEIIMYRIQTENKNVSLTLTENSGAEILTLLQEDGSFPDVNYRDRSRTGWQPLTHLSRMKTIVLAYTIEESRYYGNDTLHNAIVNGLRFWHQTDPESSNWWMQRVAVPQQMGVILILLRSGQKPLPAELEDKLLDRMKKKGGSPDQRGTANTGANKLDMATHWIYRGCLAEDEAVLSKGVEQAFYPLRFTTGEGFQHDFSYHQHGPQLYIGGYGKVIVEGTVRLAQYLTGTRYALPDDKMDFLREFLEKSYLPAIRGNHYLYNILGRGLVRMGALRQQSLEKILNELALLDPEYAFSYGIAKERITGEQNAGYGLDSMHIHFWRSDYSLHQRPGYTMDVRMASAQTRRSEFVNGENPYGYFLTEGATDIAVTGDEYADIFPVWDWSQIPGTTTLSVPATMIPRVSRPRDKFGSSDFAGGVSNGKYGVTAYRMREKRHKNLKLEAKKAWFFFDNEVVCLGTGIRTEKTTMEAPVFTTLNQCLQKGDISISFRNGESALWENGLFSYSDTVTWIHHNGIGYYLPHGGKIGVKSELRKGNWNLISPVNRDASREVFTVWFDHGSKPEDGSYAYVIIPSLSAPNEYDTQNIEILNTDSIQAAGHSELGIWGIVFHRPATFRYGEQVSIRVNRECVLLVENTDSEKITISIADPAKKYKSVTVTARFPFSDAPKEVECSLPTAKERVGSSRSFKINAETPDARKRKK